MQTGHARQAQHQASHPPANRLDYADIPDRALRDWKFHRQASQRHGSFAASFHKDRQRDHHQAPLPHHAAVLCGKRFQLRSSIDIKTNAQAQATTPDQACLAMLLGFDREAHKSNQSRRGQRPF